MELKTIVYGIIMVLCASCHDARLQGFGLPHPPQEGPPEYIAGWRDGCETGMTAYSSDYMRTRYKTAIDTTQVQNAIYRRGWEVGQRYCSYYLSTYLNNKEFFSNDLRSENAWMTLKSDGFFSYKGWETFDWDVSLAKGLF